MSDKPPLRDRIARAIAMECQIPLDEMCFALAETAILQCTTPDPDMLLAGARAMAKAGATPADVWSAMVEQAKHPRPPGTQLS